MTFYGEHYRGEGHQLAPDCFLPAHFLELQAICDALGHAAQLNMSAAITEHEHARARFGAAWAKDDPQAVGAAGAQLVKAAQRREHEYGKWLAYGYVLRALESNTSEMDEAQRAMLDLIDWTEPQRPVFRFPGRDAFDGIVQHLPGESPDALSADGSKPDA